MKQKFCYKSLLKIYNTTSSLHLEQNTSRHFCCQITHYENEAHRYFDQKKNTHICINKKLDFYIFKEKENE